MVLQRGTSEQANGAGVRNNAPLVRRVNVAVAPHPRYDEALQHSDAAHRGPNAANLQGSGHIGGQLGQGARNGGNDGFWRTCDGAIRGRPAFCAAAHARRLIVRLLLALLAEFEQIIKVILFVPPVHCAFAVARRLGVGHGLGHAAQHVQDALEKRLGQCVHLLCTARFQHQRRGAAGIPIACDILAEDELPQPRARQPRLGHVEDAGRQQGHEAAASGTGGA